MILDDIELTNENMLELRQFKPSENVMVLLESSQMSLFNEGGRQDTVPGGVIAPGGAIAAGGDAGAEEDISSGDADSQGISPFVDIIEGDVPVRGKVAKSWEF